MFLSPQNRAKQAELKFTGNAYQPLSPSLPLLPALLIPHCFYQQMARYPKPVKVYRESKTKPVTPTLILLKWLIECHKNVVPFTSYPVEKAQKVPFTASGKVKLIFL